MSMPDCSRTSPNAERGGCFSPTSRASCHRSSRRRRWRWRGPPSSPIRLQRRPAAGGSRSARSRWNGRRRVDGYNLSYAREWASQALIGGDEYAAPLVAFGQRGLGRTAAISFPLGGEHSERVRAWPKFGDFMQTIARWMMGEAAPPGIGLRHSVRGTTLAVDLLYDETWEAKLAERPPRVVIATGPRAESAREMPWRRMRPGHFRMEAGMSEGELLRGAVQVGPHALTFGPLVVGTSAEWAFDGARAEELRELAASSGGRRIARPRTGLAQPANEAIRRGRVVVFSGGAGGDSRRSVDHPHRVADARTRAAVLAHTARTQGRPRAGRGSPAPAAIESLPIRRSRA